MNNHAYMDNNIRINEERARKLPRIEISDGFISFICSLVALFTCSAAIAVEKVAVCVVCFVGFFGIIGGMESGALSAFVGLLLCALVTGVEALVLRSFAKKRR